MDELLIRTAREMTDDEADGHGGRWGVFFDDLSHLIDHWLPVAIKEGPIPELGIEPGATLGELEVRGEPAGVGFLFTRSRYR